MTWKTDDKPRVPKTNMNSEMLLRVTEDSKHEGVYWVYDITSYLPTYDGWERKRYLQNVKHSITGRNGVTVHIIADKDEISLKRATELAKGYYNGDYTTYRLD